MTFDIIDLTEEQIKNLTSAQMQLLRTAQVKKNELRVKTDEECAAFFKTVCANGMKHSSLFPHKVVSAEKRFNYETEIIAEQLLYSLNLGAEGATALSNEKDVVIAYVAEGADGGAGYAVDYTLPYTERYNAVRNYYMKISDPAERFALYAADERAKKYLGSYYSVLQAALIACAE